MFKIKLENEFGVRPTKLEFKLSPNGLFKIDSNFILFFAEIPEADSDGVKGFGALTEALI